MPSRGGSLGLSEAEALAREARQRPPPPIVRYDASREIESLKARIAQLERLVKIETARARYEGPMPR